MVGNCPPENETSCAHFPSHRSRPHTHSAYPSETDGREFAKETRPDEREGKKEQAGGTRVQRHRIRARDPRRSTPLDVAA